MQSGVGIVTLSASNSFTGVTTIQNGTLLAGNAAALGSSSGATVVTNGGTLDVNAFNLTPEPVIISGSGVGGKGAVDPEPGSAPIGCRLCSDAQTAFLDYPKIACGSFM